MITVDVFIVSMDQLVDHLVMAQLWKEVFTQALVKIRLQKLSARFCPLHRQID